MSTNVFPFIQNKNENISRRDSNILSDRIPQHCPDGQGESESSVEGVKGSALLFSGALIHHTSLRVTWLIVSLSHEPVLSCLDRWPWCCITFTRSNENEERINMCFLFSLSSACLWRGERGPIFPGALPKGTQQLQNYNQTFCMTHLHQSDTLNSLTHNPKSFVLVN